MTITDPDAPPLSLPMARPEAPYVGLRPYEEHQRKLFFGRDQAAIRLENEILAAPITVLFAPSGAGKSSLLKAKVLPDLRRRDAHVVYFDSWAVSASEGIRSAVIESLPSEFAERAKDQLLDLARAIHKQTEKGLVLILDQFEQFFICHSEEVSVLGAILGALAKFGPDTHVVLALREEYLGQLDALNPYLLTTTLVHHKLPCLSESEARQAIVRPLAEFQCEIEAALVERLLSDLRTTTTTGGVGECPTVTQEISLPFLQIVCLQLWLESPKQLTVDQYERLGARQGIVQVYVEQAMKTLSPAERLEMATILDLLAPKAGVKMAYPADVLAVQSGLKEARVSSLVDHLESQRILRRREEGKVVELFHDAFSDVLRGFIDGEFRSRDDCRELKRKRRRQWGAVGLVGLVAVCICLGMVWRKLGEARSKHHELIAALESDNCSAMLAALREIRELTDTASGPISGLLGTSRESSFTQIRDALARNSEAAAGCPGPRTFSSDIAETSEIELHYNDAGTERIQRNRLVGVWQMLTQQLWEQEGVRLPWGLRVIADKTLKPRTFALIVQKRIQLRRAIQSLGDRLAVWARFESADGGDWDTEVTGISDLTDFQPLDVPLLDKSVTRLGFAKAWSAPLWLIADERLRRNTAGAGSLEILPGAEAGIALEIYRSLLEQPALYLTDATTKALVLERQKSAPCLVSAALDRFDPCDVSEPSKALSQASCRKIAFDAALPRIRETLVAAAKGGYRPGILTRVLDRMSDVAPDASSPTMLAKWLATDQGQAQPPELLRLSTKRPSRWDCPSVAQNYPDSLDWSFVYGVDEAEKQPIRVRLGSELSRAVGDDHLEPEVLEAVRKVRHAFADESGVQLPLVNFVFERWSNDRYRIDVPGRDAFSGFSKRWNDVMPKLDSMVRSMPMAWITADEAIDRWEFYQSKRSRLCEWLESRYSRNDIKLLLRGVLGLGRIPGMVSPPEWTVRYQTPWLLSSLVFWSAACDRTDGNCLVAQLRAMQKERQRASSDESGAAPEITHGINALERDVPEEASLKFDQALRQNREAAIRAFMGNYAKRAIAFARQKTGELCEVPTPGSSSVWGYRHRVNRDLVDDVAELELDDEKRFHLELCALMYRIPSESPADDLETVAKFLEASSAEQARWSPAEQYWVGYRMLQASAQQEHSNENYWRVTEERLLASLRELSAAAQPKPDMDKILAQLHGTCEGPSSKRCTWMLVALAESDAIGLGMGMYYRLTEWASASDLTSEQALRLRSLLDRGKAALVQIRRPEYRDYWAKWIAFRQLELDVELAGYAAEMPTDLINRVDSALNDVRSLRQLSKSERAQFESWALSLKGTVLEALGRLSEAKPIRAEQHQRSRDAVRMDDDFFWLSLDGDLPKLAKAIEDALEKTGWKDEDLLFLSALSHLLLADEEHDSSSDRLFLSVNHRYRDYVRLMLWWRLVQYDKKDRARRLLDERLLEVPPNDELQRLQGGDLGPWRERLVRYYLDQKDENREQVLGPMRDRASFDQSPFSKAGQSYSSFRCEAFFYDALLQSVTGEPATAEQRCRDRLAAVLNEKCYRTYEYVMTSWLLRGPGCRLPPAQQAARL